LDRTVTGLLRARQMRPSRGNMLPSEAPQVWKSFYQPLLLTAFSLSQLATVPETAAALSEAIRPGSWTPIKPVLPGCLLARQARFCSLPQRGLTLTDDYRKVPTTIELSERRIGSCVNFNSTRASPVPRPDVLLEALFVPAPNRLGAVRVRHERFRLARKAGHFELQPQQESQVTSQAADVPA
jgi:hypothetical protein